MKIVYTYADYSINPYSDCSKVYDGDYFYVQFLLKNNSEGLKIEAKAFQQDTGRPLCTFDENNIYLQNKKLSNSKEDRQEVFSKIKSVAEFSLKLQGEKKLFFSNKE